MQSTGREIYAVIVGAREEPLFQGIPQRKAITGVLTGRTLQPSIRPEALPQPRSGPVGSTVANETPAVSSLILVHREFLTTFGILGLLLRHFSWHIFGTTGTTILNRVQRRSIIKSLSPLLIVIVDD